MSNIVKFPSSTAGAPLTAASPVVLPAKRSKLTRVVLGVLDAVASVFVIILFLLLTPLIWLLSLASFVTFVVMLFKFTVFTVGCFVLSFGLLIGLMWLLSKSR